MLPDPDTLGRKPPGFVYHPVSGAVSWNAIFDLSYDAGLGGYQFHLQRVIFWHAKLLKQADGLMRKLAPHWRDRPMKRAALILATLGILSLRIDRVEAELLSPHGAAQIVGQIPSTSLSGYNQSQTGDITFLQNSIAINYPSSDFPIDQGTSAAIAHTVPDFSHFVGGQATSTISQVTPPSFGIFPGPPVDTTAISAWRDVAFVKGTGAPPPAVTFHFTVEGTLITQFLPGYQTTDSVFAEFQARVNAPSSAFNLDLSIPPNATVELAALGTGTPSTSITGFDAFAGSASSFTATFSYTAKYDPTLGGYGFQVVENAEAYASINSYAFAEFNDPLSLSFVTNPDGTPLTGFAVSFDSGLSAATATPEPSTFSLMVAPFLGALGVMMKRFLAMRAAQA